MNYIEKMINNCKYIYSEINAATLTGAIDVVVVEQPDGTFTCSPFHVRFGKMGVLRSKEKIVDIEINGEPVDIHMKLGESGEAFFVEEVLEEEEDIIPPHLATSPIPPDGDRCFPPPADWRIDEPPHQEEPIPPEGPPGTTISESGAKTFKAETVEENASSQRKLSAPDFRPIDNRSSDTGSSSKESLSVSFNKEDSPSGDEAGGGSAGNTGGKKRGRRKRSTKKRQQQLQLQNGKDVAKKSPTQAGDQPSVKQPSQSETDIFTMDDIEITTDNNCTISIVQPSLPAPSEEESRRHVEINLDPSQLERDIHFFSDTEITPGTSPREDYGSGGPVQSDTEFETNKDREDTNVPGIPDDRKQSWKWGELPTTTATPDHDTKHHSQKWMASMLGFMKKTKHMRHESEGVYLSELNFDDPEISSLYLSTLQERHQIIQEDSREEDAESGNGPSLPQSPHSVEGVLCCQKSCLHLPLNFTQKTWPVDTAMSLCGTGATEEQFNANLVSYGDFASDPSIVFNPKLLVRIEGKVLNWKQAAPLLASLVIFRKPLPQEMMARIAEEPLNELESKVPEPSQAASAKKPYKSWFSWRKNGEEPIQEVKEEMGKTTIEMPEKIEEMPVETAIELQEQPLDLSLQSSKEEIDDKKDDSLGSPNGEKYRKTLRLTSKQIELLNLEPGANEVEFSVTTAYQGTSKCKCYLFRWKYDDKIVISDIDGTITKSDVLGHILPIVGKDWAQSGVAKLFTRIKENGYKLLYLSARAIGQSRLTREYLKSIKQEDLNLPDGPVLLNPTSLLHAFHTEVIEKKPEEFKISCLRDIQALFPHQAKPFYAGYGNKINDVWAYQAVGIPIFRIFTINHRGELKHELTETFQSTYSSMSNLVDQMFPSAKPNSVEYDFSEFVYWRDPIPDISSLPAIV